MSKERQNLSPQEIAEITRRIFEEHIQKNPNFADALARFKSNLEKSKDELNPILFDLLNQVADDFLNRISGGNDPSSASHGGDSEDIT